MPGSLSSTSAVVGVPRQQSYGQAAVGSTADSCDPYPILLADSFIRSLACTLVAKALVVILLGLWVRSVEFQFLKQKSSVYAHSISAFGQDTERPYTYRATGRPSGIYEVELPWGFSGP